MSERSKTGMAYLFSLIAILLVALNLPVPLFNVLSFLRPLLHSFGLESQWPMFATNPAKVSTRQIMAAVEFEDGTREEHVLEPWLLDDSFGRLVNENWIKFYFEALKRRNNAALWEDIARFTTKYVVLDERKSVSKVTLWRESLEIRAPKTFFFEKSALNEQSLSSGKLL